MLQKSIIIIFLAICLNGCDKPSPERHYQEIVIDAPSSKAPAMSDDPHAGMNLDIPIIPQHTREDNAFVWDVPAGWSEEPASGMRVATFKLVADPDAIDVSIVSLGGMAGGIHANLERWAKQIDLELTPEEFDTFISTAPVLKTQAGIDAVVFDFSRFQQGRDPSTKSTMAAMIELGETTLFVKMTGTIQNVRQNEAAFKQLTQSVRTK
jgi:hypothetical protein